MSKKTLGLIPARGGSKGVENKNIRDLNGKPLLAHTVEAGRDAKQVDHVVVSSDNPKIRRVATDWGADVPFKRPAELATDEARTEPVVLHALDTLAENGNKYDYVVLLQPTSPLRTAEHVDEALKQYHSSTADSLLSVFPDHTYRWQKSNNGAERINNTDKRKRRQEMETEYVENGAIYIVPVEQFRNQCCFSMGQTMLYEMSKVESIDIDTPEDLDLAACALEVINR